MKKGTRYIAVTLLIALMTVSSVSLYAKGPKEEKEQLYEYSPEVAAGAIEGAVKSLKATPENESKYRKVISEAFARYWTLSEAQASVGPNTIDDINAQNNKLRETLNNQADIKPELDSLRYLVERYLALKDTIELKKEKLNDLKDEIGGIYNQIAQNDSTLTDFKNQAEVVSQKEKDLTLVISNLALAYKNAQSKEDLSSVNVAQIDKAIEDYKASRAAIQSVLKKNVEPYDRTVEALETLKSYKDLVEKSNKAMLGKYNPKTNEALLGDFNALAENPGPTNEQRTFVSSIMKSLQNEGAAVENFCSILDSLANDIPCVPDDGDRNELKLNEVITQKVQEFNASNGTSGDAYDPRYILLNGTLLQVIQDLAPDSKMPITKINTEELYQGYLKSKVNSVK